jgi:hypothetical protein
MQCARHHGARLRRSDLVGRQRGHCGVPRATTVRVSGTLTLVGRHRGHCGVPRATTVRVSGALTWWVISVATAVCPGHPRCASPAL